MVTQSSERGGLNRGVQEGTGLEIWLYKSDLAQTQVWYHIEPEQPHALSTESLEVGLDV